MMRAALIFPLAIAASACANTSLPTGGLTAPDAPPAACKTAEVQQFVGRKATDSVGKSVLETTGARLLRWGGPDTVFTMDYRQDRVNVTYDSQGTITRIYCG